MAHRAHRAHSAHSTQHAVMLKCFRFFLFFSFFSVAAVHPFHWLHVLPDLCVCVCMPRCTCALCVCCEKYRSRNDRMPLCKVMNIWCWRCYTATQNCDQFDGALGESVAQKAERKKRETQSIRLGWEFQNRIRIWNIQSARPY